MAMQLSFTAVTNIFACVLLDAKGDKAAAVSLAERNALIPHGTSFFSVRRSNPMAAYISSARLPIGEVPVGPPAGHWQYDGNERWRHERRLFIRVVCSHRLGAWWHGIDCDNLA
jgi:hypothetical protein